MMLEMMLLLMVILVWMCELVHAKRAFSYFFVDVPAFSNYFLSPCSKNELKKIQPWL